MTSSANETNALVRRHFEGITNQNWGMVADTIAEDIVFHQGGRTHHGRDWFTNHWQDVYETIPDASVTLDHLIAEDDRVVVRITTVGTTHSEIPGIESIGTEVEFSSQIIARVGDGALAELWVVAEQPRPVSQYVRTSTSQIG